MVFAVGGMLFVVGETVFAMDGAVFVAGGTAFVAVETVFTMDGAVSLQNRQPAAHQPPLSLRFRCIWVKRLLQAGVALYTRAV